MSMVPLQLYISRSTRSTGGVTIIPKPIPEDVKPLTMAKYLLKYCAEATPAAVKHNAIPSPAVKNPEYSK